MRVHAAGVNPTDWKQRATGGLGRWSEPPILGYDVSGTVAAVGLGVDVFSPGDEVFGMPRFPHQAGAYAEYVTAPARQFAPKPASIDHLHAAALPLASLIATAGARQAHRGCQGGSARPACTEPPAAWVATSPCRSLQDRVAPASSLPHAHTITSCCGRWAPTNSSTTSSTGLRRRSRASTSSSTRSAGTIRHGRSTRYARAGCSSGSRHRSTRPPRLSKRPRAAGSAPQRRFVEPDRLALTAIADLVTAGQLRAEIAAVLPLAQAQRAHELGETGHTPGKIVLQVV